LGPLAHPTFVIYFVFIVVGLGGVGTWVEVYKLYRPLGAPPEPTDGLITSLVTFFFALTGSSCTQLIIEESESKSLRALAAGMFILALAGAFLAIARVRNVDLAVWASSLASVASLVVWWIANAKSPGLRDPDAPTGGSVKKDLPGDLTGYIVK
jgi:hypothetical protein